MSDILIRDIDDDALARLKARAKRNGRSLQSEAKLLLEQAAQPAGESVAEILAKWQRRFAGRKFSSSADSIRRDRRR
jgi:plasmid stability protein